MSTTSALPGWSNICPRVGSLEFLPTAEEQEEGTPAHSKPTLVGLKHTRVGGNIHSTPCTRFRDDTVWDAMHRQILQVSGLAACNTVPISFLAVWATKSGAS